MAKSIFDIYEDEIIEDYQNAKSKKDYVRKVAKEYGVSTMKVADFLNKRGLLTKQQLAAYVRFATDYQGKKEFDRYKAEVVKEYERAGKFPKEEKPAEKPAEISAEPTAEEPKEPTVEVLTTDISKNEELAPGAGTVKLDNSQSEFITAIVKDWLETNHSEYLHKKDLIHDAQIFTNRYEKALAYCGGDEA